MQNQEAFKTLQINRIPKRQSFRIKINQPLEFNNRSKTAQSNYVSQIASSRQTLTQSTSRKFTLWEKDWDKIQKRRQNQLNSLFRVRKQKLQQITRENRNLYIRLNTQSSLYTHRQMREKSKESQQKCCFTFKTIDMKETRQILGPIRNFSPVTGLKLGKKQIKYQDEEQNLCRLKQSVTLKLKPRESLDMRISIRKKLGFFNQHQQRIDPPQKLKSTRYLQSNKENQFVHTSRTSNYHKGLPQIYSLF